jgi:hypothetical protein
MATDEEIKEAIADRLLSGIDEKQIGDRRTKYMPVQAAYELSQKIAADNVGENGPFIKMRFGE